MERHRATCKGISHPFECRFCHKVFSSCPGKSRHEKTCKEKQQEAPAPAPPTVTNNIELQQNAETITNNTSNTIHNTTVNNTIINNNLISVPLAENKLVMFNTDHITQEALLQVIKSSATPPDGLYNFAVLLLKNPRNHIARKTNKRDSYSKVHVGDNKWTIVPDKKLYPKFTDSVTSEAAQQVEFELKDSDYSAKKKKQHLDYYNDVVSSAIPPTKTYREAKKLVETAFLNHYEEQKSAKERSIAPPP